MSQAHDEYEPTKLTRREALSGGSAAAVAAGSFLLQKQLVQAASAQTSEPRIELGQDWVIDDNPDGNGAFVVEHTPNSNRYIFQDDGTLDAPAIDTDDISVTNVGSVIEKTADQTVSADTETKITFGNEVDDDAGEFDLANNQFSPSKDGDYFINASLLWNSPSDQTYIETIVYKNGTGLRSRFSQQSGNGNISTVLNCRLSDLTTSDTIEIYGKAGEQATITGVGKYSYITITRVG